MMVNERQLLGVQVINPPKTLSRIHWAHYDWLIVLEQYQVMPATKNDDRLLEATNGYGLIY